MHSFASQLYVERCESLRRAEWAKEPLHSIIRRAYDNMCAEENSARYVAYHNRDCQRNLARQTIIVWC